MKACRFHETGPPEVLRYEDVPDPRPGPGEALVEVRAAALNRLDTFLRAGASTMPGFSMPHTGGFDMAGVVTAVGPGADERRIGQEVVVNARVTGPQARGRLDIIGIARPGGFAEYVVVPEHCLAPKPKDYSWEEAAAFGCVYLTAYYGIVHRAGVRPGEVVLVHGASGGAGSAAVQVAKTAGAFVVGTAGTAEKCQKVKKLLGADVVVNYKSQGVVAAVKDASSGKGADIIFDPVWGTAAQQSLDCIALGGRWLVLGMVGGLDAEINAAKFMFREARMIGIVEFYADPPQVDEAWRLAHRALVRPIVERTYPLAELAAAHRAMETGDAFGKIVIKP